MLLPSLGPLPQLGTCVQGAEGPCTAEGGRASGPCSLLLWSLNSQEVALVSPRGRCGLSPAGPQLLVHSFTSSLLGTASSPCHRVDTPSRLHHGGGSLLGWGRGLAGPASLRHWRRGGLCRGPQRESLPRAPPRPSLTFPPPGETPCLGLPFTASSRKPLGLQLSAVFAHLGDGLSLVGGRSAAPHLGLPLVLTGCVPGDAWP